jgi:photosystem II stability/assembly factor-like uncharacterized protein
MKTTLTNRFYLVILLFLITISNVFAQKTIYDILYRYDLTFKEIQKLAEDHINQETNQVQKDVDTEKYQMWLFERKFHLDSKGYFRKPSVDFQSFIANSKASTLSASDPWTELGPKSFTATTGWNPGVGKVTSVAVNPANNAIIYISSPGGGIWKTINSGTTWTPLVDNTSTFMDVNNLAIDPSNPNTIFAAVNTVGVIKSTNAGANWAMTGAGTTFPKKVMVHPTNSNKIYATGDNGDGIYESSNGGTTWTQRLAGVSMEDMEFKPNDPTIMYASGNNAAATTFYRSADGGITWTAITSGITNAGRTITAVSPADANVVYMIQANGNIFGKLYKSTDSGLNFVTLITGNPANNTNFFGYDNGEDNAGQPGANMSLAVNPTNANDLSMGAVNVWRSQNGGTTFAKVTNWNIGAAPNGYNHADVNDLVYVGANLYSGSDGGIYRTDYSVVGANSWTDLSTGLGTRQFYRIATSLTNANVWGGGAQDNGTVVRQAGGNYADWLGADGMDMIIDPNNHLNIIGTTQNGSIYRTTDGGTTQAGLTRPAAGNWVTPLAWHPTNSNIVYGGWNFVYRSDDAGTTWTNISPTITSAGNFDALTVAPSNDQYIYAAKGTVLWVTANGGTTWTSYTLTDAISQIAVKYNNPQKVWITTASTTQPVMLSTNGGATFTNISAGLPAISGRSIAVEDSPAENIYVGLNIGVYYRNIASNTWVLFGTGLPQVAINEVEISKIAGKLRIGTYGRGGWEIPLANCSLSVTYGATPQTAGTYTAVETINSQATIANTTNYFAGKNINLTPPFNTAPSAVFTARIQGCN